MPALCAASSAGPSVGASGKTISTFTLSVTSVLMSETCWLADSPAFSAMTLSPTRLAAAVSAAWNACSTGWVSCGLANPMVMWLDVPVLAGELPVAADTVGVLPPVAPVEDADVHAATVSDAAATVAASAPFFMFTSDLLIKLPGGIGGGRRAGPRTS